VRELKRVPSIERRRRFIIDLLADEEELELGWGRFGLAEAVEAMGRELVVI
jgi:hypothetical protein